MFNNFLTNIKKHTIESPLESYLKLGYMDLNF